MSCKHTTLIHSYPYVPTCLFPSSSTPTLALYHDGMTVLEVQSKKKQTFVVPLVEGRMHATNSKAHRLKSYKVISDRMG